ncbi:hypothetical protein BOTNAR_0482g00020 [Botryotinia narcissicola]|uniref:Uncharacterized protein n=1 Tax=Botryotinia narcissicola TaxID=278944 RepID=A0A4Z1HGT6_9HELO|nr:hypothetical protein BOTNAR_0482g00020 [Botryotinia narcissicola]
MPRYSESTRDSQYDNQQQQRQRQGTVNKEQREAIRKKNEKREREKYEQRKKEERQYGQARADGRVDSGNDRSRGEKVSERNYGKISSGEMSGKKGVRWK